MRSETRLSLFLKKSFFSFQEKFLFFQMHFASSIFFLFFGFLTGNLFGTFLNAIRGFLPWDGLIVLVVLVIIEIISYITYHSNRRPFLSIWQFRNFSKSAVFWKSLNYFKIGLLIGFFIDAFKVGS
jgi:hypothetical protein